MTATRPHDPSLRVYVNRGRRSSPLAIASSCFPVVGGPLPVTLRTAIIYRSQGFPTRIRRRFAQDRKRCSAWPPRQVLPPNLVYGSDAHRGALGVGVDLHDVAGQYRATRPLVEVELAADPLLGVQTSGRGLGVSAQLVASPLPVEVAVDRGVHGSDAFRAGASHNRVAAAITKAFLGTRRQPVGESRVILRRPAIQ